MIEAKYQRYPDSLNQYLKELADEKPLKKEEEADLFNQIKNGSKGESNSYNKSMK